MRPTTNDLAKAAGFSRSMVAANLARGKDYRFLFLLPRTGISFWPR